MVKNIIWDFDGTLFDTYPAITRGYQLALLDFEFDMPLELFDAMTRISMTYCIEKITSSFKVDEAAYLDRFREHYGKMTPESSPPFPGAVAVCEDIVAQGGQNFLVTHRRKTSTIELMQHFKVELLFTDCLFGDDGFERKPHPAMFNHVIEKYYLSRSETLAVGDRLLDIEAGNAAGLQTCLYVKLREGLQKADNVISSYTDFNNSFKR